MSVYTVTCLYCNGRGVAQVLEERTERGWIRQRAPFMDHAVADAWIARDGDRAPVRWVDCECPKCGGAREYEIESTPCKIF